MRGLRGVEGGRALALTAAVVVAAGLAVMVPAAAGLGLPAAHADQDGAEPGMIVVADRGNNRLQAFYPDGTFAFTFGLGFGKANSIDIGSDGMIVTTEPYLGVHAFYPNGTYAFQVVWHGEGIGLVQHPVAAAVAPNGRIVVAEASRIQVFEPDGTFASVFGVSRHDEPPPRSWGVTGMVVAPNGRIVVSDFNYRGGCYDRNDVRIIHPNGTAALSFAVYDDHCGVINGVDVAPDGQIVVGTSYGVQVYRPLPNGTFLNLPLNGTSYKPGTNGTIVDMPGIEVTNVGDYSGVAVGPNGEIVVGSNDDLVRVFHANGTRALTFGGHGSVQGGFDRPTDAAVGPDGRIVVAEPGNRTISVFHPNGTLDFAFGEYGHGDDAFYEPHQVAVGPDGRIVVGDTRKHRILVFEPDGAPALAFGSSGGGAGQINHVRDVAVAPNGNIVVVDAPYGSGGRVQVFSPDGMSVSELRGDSWHWSPGQAAVSPDGRILVTEAYSESSGIHVFEPNGTVAFTIPLDRPPTHLFGTADAVAVGPDGRFVVVQGSLSRVFNPDGTFAFATEIDVDAVSVAVGPNREIVVVDDDADRVQVFNPNGTFAFALLPDVSQGKFDGVGAVAVGPVMPRPIGDPDPLWAVVGPDVGGPILRNFTDVGDVANVTIDVAALAGPGGADSLNGSESSTVTFPASETVVIASFAEVTFPPNVTASYVPAGGKLALRVAADVPAAEQVQAALGRNGSGPELVVLLQSVVEVGAEAGPRIMFDLPIRIALEGQAGGRAFYIEGPNGTIVPIDAACAADDVDAAHQQMGGVGECQIDSADGAKVVHTYHLTKFGTVSAGGPVPGIVVDPDQPTIPSFMPGGGGGGSNGTNGTVAPLPPVVVVPPPDPAVEPTFGPTCSVYLSEPEFALTAMPGGYSEPFIQEVQNAGSLPFAQVEIEATPWQDAAMPLPAAPRPPLPPSTSGQVGGTAPSVFTAYLLATMPASVTEMREAGRFVGGEFIESGDGVDYAPLVDGTAVVGRGLGADNWVDLSFRLNLTPYDALQGGTLTQSITYQAECVEPAAPPTVPRAPDAPMVVPPA